MSPVYTYSSSNRPKGLLARALGFVVVSLIGFVLNLVFRRVFNVSVQNQQKHTPMSDQMFGDFSEVKKPKTPIVRTSTHTEEADWQTL